MIKKTLQIEKKARYFLLGNPGDDTSIVWVVLHGYGMLSEFFIQKFKKLENKNTLILAPEALNRFYIDTNYGRVGASRMTKDERQDDIKENIKYLNSLMDQIIREIGHNRFKINVLGFSQGGATACRWLFKSGLKFENLIMWAGDIPKDTLTEENRLKWSDMNTHLVMGKKDELINEEMILNADFILHGHTHRYRSELIKNTLVFNPGECAGILKDKNNIGLLDTEKKTSKIINF